MMIDELPNNLRKFVEVDGTCWMWTGHRNIHGYGTTKWRKSDGTPVTVSAHRVTYHLANPEVPVRGTGPHHVVDHLCRNRACVNPSHLEYVSQRENCGRGALSDLKSGRTSTYRGVTLHRKAGKWQAQIHVGPDTFYLGLHDTPEGASEAYEAAAKDGVR